LLGRAEGGRGSYDVALEALEAGFVVAEETHNPFGRAMYANQRAWLSAELGDWETAYDLDRAGLEAARAAPIRPPEISTLLNLVLDCTMLDRLDEADGYLLALQQWMGRPEFGFHGWRWQMREADARARLHIARSQQARAADLVADLLDRAARTQSHKYLARAHLMRAQIRRAQGDLHAVREDLVAARDLADVMCHFPTRLQARRGLVRLHQHIGSHYTVNQLQSEVARLTVELDSRLKHPDLRQSFQRSLAYDYGFA